MTTQQINRAGLWIFLSTTMLGGCLIAAAGIWGGAVLVAIALITAFSAI